MAEMASSLIQVKFYYINKYYCMIPLNKAAISFLDSFFLTGPRENKIGQRECNKRL